MDTTNANAEKPQNASQGKPLAQPPMGDPASQAGNQKPQSMETVLQRLTMLESENAHLKQQVGNQKNIVAREGFITRKMADVPPVYLAQLGEDPAKWPEQEQAIRSQYQADLEKAGHKAADLGGDSGGEKVSSLIDPSKIGTAYQNIMEGLKNRQPANV